MMTACRRLSTIFVICLPHHGPSRPHTMPASCL
jgi:hypothetical protein